MQMRAAQPSVVVVLAGQISHGAVSRNIVTKGTASFKASLVWEASVGKTGEDAETL
jgi:hypothetical protein